MPPATPSPKFRRRAEPRPDEVRDAALGLFTEQVVDAEIGHQREYGRDQAGDQNMTVFQSAQDSTSRKRVCKDAIIQGNLRTGIYASRVLDVR